METINLGIFATGKKDKKDGGGSGLRNILETFKKENVTDILIRVIVSNFPDGSIAAIAKEFCIPFVYLPNEKCTAENYQKIWSGHDLHFVHTSGFLRKIFGLPKEKVFNIHPGPLPETTGLYGHKVHEIALPLVQKKIISHTKVTLHYVNEEYDKGEKIYEHWVYGLQSDTVETFSKRVNEVEHKIQPTIVKLVVRGHIKLENGKVLRDAEAYKEQQKLCLDVNYLSPNLLN